MPIAKIKRALCADHYTSMHVAKEDITKLLLLISDMQKVITEYSTTLANNGCVDYHVCCGVASDLSHTPDCKVMDALSLYDEKNS